MLHKNMHWPLKAEGEAKRKDCLLLLMADLFSPGLGIRQSAIKLGNCSLKLIRIYVNLMMDGYSRVVLQNLKLLTSEMRPGNG